jgi:hypothetical protein
MSLAPTDLCYHLGMTPHEIEEIEHRFGPRMWDATPGVCCAYFQIGACSHTEYDPEPWTDLTPAELADLTAAEDERRARLAPMIDEPF